MAANGARRRRGGVAVGSGAQTTPTTRAVRSHATGERDCPIHPFFAPCCRPALWRSAGCLSTMGCGASSAARADAPEDVPLPADAGVSESRCALLHHAIGMLAFIPPVQTAKPVPKESSTIPVSPSAISARPASCTIASRRRCTGDCRFPECPCTGPRCYNRRCCRGRSCLGTGARPVEGSRCRR